MECSPAFINAGSKRSLGDEATASAEPMPSVSGRYGRNHCMISIRLPSGSCTKNRSHPGIGVVSRVGTSNFRKMLAGGSGIFHLQGEMARAGRVGRLARNQMNVLRAEVVPHDDEIECSGPGNLAQTEDLRVEASRPLEVGHHNRHVMDARDESRIQRPHRDDASGSDADVNGESITFTTDRNIGTSRI